MTRRKSHASDAPAGITHAPGAASTEQPRPTAAGSKRWPRDRPDKRPPGPAVPSGKPVSPLVAAHVAWSDQQIRSSLRQLAAHVASRGETRKLIALSHARLAASRRRL